jgi:hypothetical protein
MFQVPIVFTWEIYGDQKAHINDCFRMFNPVTPDHRANVVDNWAAAFFTFFKLAPSHPDIPKVRPSIQIKKRSFNERSDRSATEDDIVRVVPFYRNGLRIFIIIISCSS